MYISVVIPVYKTSSTLIDLVSLLKITLEPYKGKYEIIFVDDGGAIDSAKALKKILKGNAHIRVIWLSRNYGQHNAILCGVLQARGEIIVTMDDDLQHPPAVLPKLFSALKDDVDVVYGSSISMRHNFFRSISARLTKIILQDIMGADNASHVSALRIFRSSITKSWIKHNSPLVNIDVMLTWATDRFSYVLVDHKERAVGQSGYTFMALVRHALNLITGFSTLPLQVASIFGLFFAIFGFVVLIFVLYTWFYSGVSVPGFAFIASLISILSGVQLLSIGVMGEYISRMFERGSGKPPYLIRESEASLE
jgi:glycosyltransferase involved in cell wall biosynthesis